MEMIKKRKLFYFISLSLSVLSILSIGIFGLNLGIDFTGGSQLEIEYIGEVPGFDAIEKALDLDEIVLQKSSDNVLILKTKEITEVEHQEIVTVLRSLGDIKEGSESFQSIGPVIGQELKSKTKLVIILSLLCILLYIAYSFRRISKPVKSYVYGLTSLIALFHDVLIPLGVFAVLGKFYGVEITIPIITAFLTVFGYSINDSVVVFDRVRENLVKLSTPDFEETIQESLKQTITRSLNTSLTTLIALLAIFLFGGATLRFFSLALILGIGLGTYSSLFLATPLLVTYYKLRRR